MKNHTNEHRTRKYATVLKCENGIATVRVHNDSHGCRGCGGNKQKSCTLYAFGSIFSRHHDIRHLPSKHPFIKGEKVQLVAPTDALLKIAAGCYGLPIVILLTSATSTHLLVGIEWFTVLVGAGSLILSYLLIKRWLRSIRIPSIQITQ